VPVRTPALKPLGAPSRRTDLRDNNRIYELLDQLEEGRRLMAEGRAKSGPATAEILELLGDAEDATVRGWTLHRVTFERREYTVPAGEVTRLWIRRKQLLPRGVDKTEAADHLSNNQTATKQTRANKRVPNKHLPIKCVVHSASSCGLDRAV
jgi:hypothetical protein